MRVLVALHLHQLLVLSVIFLFSRDSGCGMVSHHAQNTSRLVQCSPKLVSVSEVAGEAKPLTAINLLGI